MFKTILMSLLVLLTSPYAYSNSNYKMDHKPSPHNLQWYLEHSYSVMSPNPIATINTGSMLYIGNEMTLTNGKNIIICYLEWDMGATITSYCFSLKTLNSDDDEKQ